MAPTAQEKAYMDGRFETKVLRSVGISLAKELPPLETIDYWSTYKWELAAKLMQCTFDRPGGQMKFENFQTWVDGDKSDTEALDGIPADIDYLMSAAASQMLEDINPGEKGLLRELVSIRLEDEVVFKKMADRPGVVKLRRIDRFFRKTEMAVTSRLKERYMKMAYNIGGTKSISSYMGEFGRVARAYYGTAFDTNQKAIVQDLVKSIYGVGLDANKVEQAIKLNCSLNQHDRSVTFRAAMEYLRELLANTERQSDVANNATESNGSGGKENRDKRPLSGNKRKMDKGSEPERKKGCRRCGKEHELNKCPKMTCFKCKGKGHGKDLCPSEHKADDDDDEEAAQEESNGNSKNDSEEEPTANNMVHDYAAGNGIMW